MYKYATYWPEEEQDLLSIIAHLLSEIIRSEISKPKLQNATIKTSDLSNQPMSTDHETQATAAAVRTKNRVILINQTRHGLIHIWSV